MIAIANRRASFSNPGIKDFLTGVILTDRLFWPLLNRFSTYEEIDAAWSFYYPLRAQLGENGEQAFEWLSALNRVYTGGDVSVIRVISLAIQVASEFKDNDEKLLQFFSHLMQRLRATPAQAADDTYFRYALEYRGLMSESKRKRIQDLDAITEKSAALLMEQGASLSLSDIRMLASALDEHGEQPELSLTAAKTSIDDWLTYSFETTVDEAASVQELEEICSDLSKLTDSAGMELGAAYMTAMDARRLQLLEDEESRESDVYETSRWKAPEPDFSDEQVRSLFSTIID
jgi:hypothetical protein